MISIYQLCSLVYHLDVFHWSASHRYFTSCPIHTFNKHCRPEIPTAKPNSIPLSNTAYYVDLLAGLKNHHHRPQVTVICSSHSIPPRVIETCKSPSCKSFREKKTLANHSKCADMRCIPGSLPECRYQCIFHNA